MPKPWYSIKAAAEGETDEISILDPIDSWYGVNAKSFLGEVRALKGKKIKLSINSPGGSVVEALAIFNGLRASGKEIEVHVLGIAASAASYIAMAGDKIVMPKNTLMFLHNPISGAYGNADELRDVADTLDKVGEALTGAYMRRFKGKDEDLKAILDKETLLTADECLEYGLCDEVVPEIQAKAHFDTDGLPEQIKALFKPAPADPAPAVSSVAAADIERIVAEVGVPEFAADLALDDTLTTVDAVAARAKQVVEIKALCRVVNAADKTGWFVQATASARKNASMTSDASPSPTRHQSTRCSSADFSAFQSFLAKT